LSDARRKAALGARGPELAAQFRSDQIAAELLASYERVRAARSAAAN
jgi:hypothetical protein